MASPVPSLNLEETNDTVLAWVDLGFISRGVFFTSPDLKPACFTLVFIQPFPPLPLSPYSTSFTGTAEFLGDETKKNQTNPTHCKGSALGLVRDAGDRDGTGTKHLAGRRARGWG